jgi:Rrf2 family protein
VVRSFRGARRGYSLAREPRTFRLRDLIETVEGPGVFERCIFWSNRCNGDNPCSLHEGWSRLKPDLVRYLEHTTLADLAGRAASGRPLGGVKGG